MRFPRASGVLLHPTSLPGPGGIGELGPQAVAFVDWLAKAGQTLWQVLPLGPVGFGSSPYACYSAFAGNPMLLSLELLARDRLLDDADLTPLSRLPTGPVDYEAMWALKLPLLEKAFQRFRVDATAQQRQAFRSWCEVPGTAAWLEDFALFMAIKASRNNEPWLEWEPDLVRRDPTAIRRVAEQLAEQVWFQRFLQWQFSVQWLALRGHAHRLGVQIIGDIPIYVADDSADVWSHPELFDLDARGHRRVVAGVPPDYFSETGQLWGNPLYRWDRMESTGYSWWIHRFRVLFSQVDRIRLDHFRGFEAYWEVPAGEETAIHGRWVKGPDARMFVALQRAMGEVPIIAEDLGIITPEVETLRDRFDFPGMRILQFAFGGDAGNPYLPHNYVPNSVVYTGTHDNDTLVGWLGSEKPEIVQKVREYLGVDAPEVSLVWPLIRLAQQSVSDTCILPMQDLLELPTAARMNTPSEKAGNWLWRCAEGALTDSLAEKLKRLALRYGRAKEAEAAAKAV